MNAVTNGDTDFKGLPGIHKQPASVSFRKNLERVLQELELLKEPL